MRYQSNQKKLTMSRMHPKPDVQKLLKFINSGSIAGLQQFNILVPTKKKIMAMLEKNPLGIALEKFSTAYEAEFGEWLNPSVFGYSDMVEMLNALDDIVDMKLTESNDQMLLFSKSGKIKGPDNNEKNTTVTEMRKEVIDTFRIIISSLGGISVDMLIPEYESRTNQKLNLQKLGFDSFPHLLSHLSEVFKTCKRDGQVFLLDPATPTVDLLQDSTEHTNTPAEGMSRSFDVTTAMNLRQLLEEEFPCGLKLNELYAAYEGFYGSGLKDLNYEKHGFGSFEAFLGANSDVVSLHHHQGTMCVLPCQPLQHPKPEQINLSCTGSVVGPNESYSLVERLPSGKVQVIVGEVYTPKRFWVMHYGEHHSKQLDKLMDGMLEFYRSALGNRYRLPERRVTNQMVVAAFYPHDQNFYRAFVLSVEDLTTVKLLFVDYGTVWVSCLDHLRLLHKNFFALPAQAIKCSLHGILPANGKRTWGHSCSKRFLDLVQNQRLVAEVVSEEMTTIIKLWDTSQEEDVSIGDLLVRDNLVSSASGFLDDSSHTQEAVASSSIPALEIDRGSHIECSSCSFDPEEASSQTKGAGAQNPLAHERASGQAKNLDAQSSNNSTPIRGNKLEESLPHTRSAASTFDDSLLDCSQIGKCSSDHMNGTAAGGRQPYLASTPMEKEIVTVDCPPTLSNEIFVSDEEFPEDNSEEDGLSHSYLIHPVEVSLNKKIHVILIDGIQYMLNTEFPHMENKVYHLGITLRKEINQDIYRFLIENDCNIYEPSGEVRASLILYPLTHMAAVLAQDGYSIATHLHQGMDIQKWSPKYHSSELLKRGNYELHAFPNTSHSKSSIGSTSTKTYKHGAQVMPPRRPCTINKFSMWSPVTKMARNTRHQ
ncbi:hypothetical protein O3P69_016790 [Scylla paramamosain]|uniref:Uncharacterized protein n=1 Tax=Scylla paramamosain TaxID=85552 RepID=A0AAW0T0M6_SCYPA